MIIDAHMHIDDLPALGWKLDAELCIRRMDEAGIDAAVVMTITDWPEVNAQSIELVAGVRSPSRAPVRVRPGPSLVRR